VSFTLPDLGPVMPLARPLRPRVDRLARVLAEASARTGAILVDFTVHPFASDPRLWSEDRLHANSVGHARIADALAHAIALPGSSADWMTPLPPAAPTTRRDRVAAELAWAWRFLLPWLSRHARGRSSGDGRVCKRPHLRLLEPPRTVIE
jgi:hypothetical protein